MTPSDLSGKDFAAWRKKMGWSQKHAAKVIGVSAASVRNFEREKRSDTDRRVEIPLTVAWACSAILAGLRPLGE